MYENTEKTKNVVGYKKVKSVSGNQGLEIEPDAERFRSGMRYMRNRKEKPIRKDSKKDQTQTDREKHEKQVDRKVGKIQKNGGFSHWIA